MDGNHNGRAREFVTEKFIDARFATMGWMGSHRKPPPCIGVYILWNTDTGRFPTNCNMYHDFPVVGPCVDWRCSPQISCAMNESPNSRYLPVRQLPKSKTQSHQPSLITTRSKFENSSVVVSLVDKVEKKSFPVPSIYREKASQ